MRYCFELFFVENSKDKKSPRGRGKKKKKQSSNRCPEEFKASIEVDEINEVLTALNMHVAEWKKEEPTYKKALWIVATSLGWAMTELLFRMRWTLKYQLLGQELSDDDREVRDYHIAVHSICLLNVLLMVF